jgi:CRP-like cAMP-binding protein
VLDQRDHDVAKQALLFKSLPEAQVTRLLDMAQPRDCVRGETLFLQDEPARHVYVVLDGWVKLYRLTPTGAEAIVGVFTQKGTFAEAAALSEEPLPVAAEAVTDCRLLQIPASTLLREMREHPEMAIAMLVSSFKHLHGLVSQIEQLKAHTGAQRVAEFLAELCPVSEGACTITLPYDKSLIAGRLGMKPESLSRTFARLRALGVTVSQNHAAIADVESLRNYVDEDRSGTLGKGVA